jgi:ABC-type phosphate transport system ATPase subunit
VALKDVNLEIREHEIFGIIGPANAGKTSFLKAVNRMDMFTTGMRVAGEIRFNGLRYPPPEERLCAAQPHRRRLSFAGRSADDGL